MEKIFTVRLSADEKAVEILDQTLLPNRVEYLRLKLRSRSAKRFTSCASAVLRQ